MEEWDISVVSPQLKGKQEEMQGASAKAVP